MKKFNWMMLAVMCMVPGLAFAMGSSTPERKCLNKTWSKPFVCGGEALYKKLGSGTATEAEKAYFTECSKAHKQSCCDTYVPGSVWNQNSDSCNK